MFHAEFGLGYSFASYRGKGSLPASGPMYFSQLYGASNIVREPASGETYALNSTDWKMNPTGGGDGKGRLDIVWGGAAVYGNGTPAATTSVLAGGKTYYRGTLMTTISGLQHFGLYRTTP
jgi:hypothetical protein